MDYEEKVKQYKRILAEHDIEPKKVKNIPQFPKSTEVFLVTDRIKELYKNRFSQRHNHDLYRFTNNGETLCGCSYVEDVCCYLDSDWPEEAIENFYFVDYCPDEPVGLEELI
jgi:hypothetical protein